MRDGASRGTARLVRHQAQALSIAGDSTDCDEVPVIRAPRQSDSTDGKIALGRKFLIKLYVEGFESKR